VTDLTEDGGLVVARGWKHEELAGAAIGAGGGVVEGRTDSWWERRASDPVDNEGEDANVARAEICVALGVRGCEFAASPRAVQPRPHPSPGQPRPRPSPALASP